MLMNIAKENRFFYVLLFLFASLLPLTFALYTEHAWEDWFITYRSAKNLAVGNGLVYTVGERVHSFTSPLGTLIPAALNFITNNSSDGLVLWLYRLLNCILFGLTATILLKISDLLDLNRWSKIFLIGMFIFDAKMIDFSINGMETGLMVFFFSLTVYALLSPLRIRGILLGVAWGGLMWTRPDSFVYILALIIAFIIFNPGTSITQDRGDLFRLYCFSGTITSLIYTPWLVWAWSYYESFIPHTIVAKGVFYNLESVYLPLLTDPAGMMGHYLRKSFADVFSPAYIHFLGWPNFIRIVSVWLALVAAFAFMAPRVPAITRALSCAAFIAHIYLNLAVETVFPWYYSSVGILSIVVIALILDQCLKLLERHRGEFEGKEKIIPVSVKVLLQSFAVLTLAVAFSLTLATAYQFRVQQDVVEEGNRKQIGLWLRQHASPDDRVFLEPLGYIGFYSGLKMLDFPGLSSPEVVAARRTLRTNRYGDLIDYLEPEWIVLRPGEVARIRETRPRLLDDIYSEIEVFDVSEQIASYPFIPGRDYLEYDQTFLVFRRK